MPQFTCKYCLAAGPTPGEFYTFEECVVHEKLCDGDRQKKELELIAKRFTFPWIKNFKHYITYDESIPSDPEYGQYVLCMEFELIDMIDYMVDTYKELRPYDKLHMIHTSMSSNNHARIRVRLHKNHQFSYMYHE